MTQVRNINSSAAINDYDIEDVSAGSFTFDGTDYWYNVNHGLNTYNYVYRIKIFVTALSRWVDASPTKFEDVDENNTKFFFYPEPTTMNGYMIGKVE